MSPYKRPSKNKTPASHYERMSALGNDPSAWDALSNDELKDLVIHKCIEYGVVQNEDLILMLYLLYKQVEERIDVSERMELFNQFGAMTEEREGEGHMGLLVFLSAEGNPGIHGRHETCGALRSERGR